MGNPGKVDNQEWTIPGAILLLLLFSRKIEKNGYWEISTFEGLLDQNQACGKAVNFGKKQTFVILIKFVNFSQNEQIG